MKHLFTTLALVAMTTSLVSAAEPAATPQKKSEKPKDTKDTKDTKDKKTVLFDGRTLDGWRDSGFSAQGRAEVKDGSIVINTGETCSGVTWTKDFPTTDYELRIEAKRVDGQDFFCGVTFPVAREKDKVEPCTFIVGGWGGGTVGLSSIDGNDASENSTSQYKEFKNDKWYKIRVRVTKSKIETWIDDEKIVNFTLGKHELSIRIEVDRSKPLGIATWQTTAALRNIEVERVTGPESPPNKDE
ncbi:MAG: DUF1080 domain-containing protein [Pirellulales bacterium]